MKRMEADVIVIGGGMSGLVAATAASQHDASVIVFEKSGTVGGAANMGMGFFAVESRYQRQQLCNHTVDGLFKEFMTYNHWRVNAPLVRKIYESSARNVEWLEDMGVEFLGAFKYFENSNTTWHVIKVPGSNRPTERAASGMIKRLHDTAEANGVEFCYRTSVTKILTGDKGQVIGVMAQGEDGETIEALSSSVIVASGGFGDNPDMIRERIGLNWGEDLYSFRIPGLKGDGIRMVEAIGGALAPSVIEVTYTTPGVTDVYKTISETMRQPNLMVNYKGKRFIDESIMNNTTFTGNAISIQPKRKGFSILTDSVLDEYRRQGHLDYITFHHNIQTVDNWDREVAAYFSNSASGTEGLAELQVAMSEEQQFYVADSLEELAQKTGIDYENLRKTVDEYNADADTYDSKFNKPHKFMRKLQDGGKWYAAGHFICGYGTLAGIKTDDELRILNEDFDPIPGLYGCGTDVCSIFGDSYNFSMPGSTMGFAIHSGRMAGDNAMNYIDSDSFVE